MARVEVDISQVQQAVARSAQEVRRLPGRVLAVARRAAATERASKTYRDRTGDLVDATKATIARGGDRFTVTLAMGEHYASYIVRRGFSRFHDHAAGAAGDVAFVVAQMGARLSRI